MKNKYIINGKFLADRMQGIVRYAREITKALDKCLGEEIDVTLLVPRNAYDIPNFNRIKVNEIGNHTGLIWEQTDLRRYLIKYKDAICINLCNVCPLFVQPGITTIHDIMYKVNPKDYKTIRNRLSRFWHVFHYQYASMHEKTIIVTSNFTKGEIIKYYPALEGKVRVIPAAWQHIKEFKESTDWQDKYPFLRPKEFYFSLSTLSRNKNGRWIIENAKKNRNYIYAIAGKYYETDKYEIPANVHMLGFISDEDACALIKNCRAFIHPSLYEGFGIPPLEALALGTDIISFDATSLPEVLGNCVHYINPLDWNVDLDVLLNAPVESRERVLEQYSWDKSARLLLSVLSDPMD